MSLEETRTAIYEMALDEDPHYVPRQQAASVLLARLILEVQAEMPCYHRYENTAPPELVAECEWPDCDWCVTDCPSCTARMKLKEVTA